MILLIGESPVSYKTEESILDAVGTHIEWIRQKDRELAESLSLSDNEYNPMSYYFEFFLNLRDLLDDVAHNPQTMRTGYYTDRKGIQYENLTQGVIDVFEWYSNTNTHRFLTTVTQNSSGKYWHNKKLLSDFALKETGLLASTYPDMYKDMYADLYTLKVRLDHQDERVRRVNHPFSVSGFMEMILGDKLFPTYSFDNYKDFLEAVAYSKVRYEKLGGR